MCFYKYFIRKPPIFSLSLCGLLLLVQLCIQLRAQILNVEKSRIQPDSARYWIANIGLASELWNRSALQSAPLHYLSASANLDIARVGKQHMYFLLNQYNYLKINKNEFFNFGYTHARLNLYWTRRSSYELYAQWQIDRGRGLQARTLVGGGLRIRLLDKAQHQFFAGCGLMLESEHWQIQGSDTAYLAHPLLCKTASYLRWRGQLTQQLNGNLVVYFQTGYDPLITSFRHRISSELYLNMPITSHLRLTTSLTAAYESHPQIPITPFVYRCMQGLRWQL